MSLDAGGGSPSGTDAGEDEEETPDASNPDASGGATDASMVDGGAPLFPDRPRVVGALPYAEGSGRLSLVWATDWEPTEREPEALYLFVDDGVLGAAPLEGGEPEAYPISEFSGADILGFEAGEYELSVRRSDGQVTWDLGRVEIRENRDRFIILAGGPDQPRTHVIDQNPDLADDLVEVFFINASGEPRTLLLCPEDAPRESTEECRAIALGAMERVDLEVARADRLMAAAPLPDEPGYQPYYDLAGEPIGADHCFTAVGADEPVRFSARMALVVAPPSSRNYTYLPDHAWSIVYPCGG